MTGGLVRRHGRTSAIGALGAIAVLLAMASPLDAGASAATVTLTATTKNPVVTGDTWVTFARAGYSEATLQGTASGVAVGAVAKLLAQAFPYQTAPRVVATSALAVAGTSAPFSFSVAPQLSTHYAVEVLASSVATTAEGTSTTLTVYATSTGSGSNAESCRASRCTLTVHLTTVVPPSTIGVERRKHEFTYLDLVTTASGVRPTPTTYALVNATVRGPTVTGRDLHYVLTIAYREPRDAYWFFWEACTRDTLSLDGLGLPGHHGCGDRTFVATSPYLG
jgi:hypothetical protein